MVVWYIEKMPMQVDIEKTYILWHARQALDLYFAMCTQKKMVLKQYPLGTTLENGALFWYASQPLIQHLTLILSNI